MKRDDTNICSNPNADDDALRVDTGDTITQNSMIFFSRPNEVVTPDGFKERRSMTDIKNVLFRDAEETRSSNSTPLYKQFRYYDDFQDLREETEMIESALKQENIVLVSTGKQELKIDTLPKNSPPRKMMSVDLERADLDDCNEIKIKTGDSFPVLPPLPLRSWSTEGDGVATPGTYILSSRSGQTYSWGESTNKTNASPLQAKSPQLELGRTRTAVGNLLVSMQQQQQQQNDPQCDAMLQNVSTRFSTFDISWSHTNGGQITTDSSYRHLSHVLPVISEKPDCLDHPQTNRQSWKHLNQSAGVNDDLDSSLFSPLTTRSQATRDGTNPTQSQKDLPLLFLPVHTDGPAELTGKQSYIPTNSFLMMHQRLLQLENQSKAMNNFQEQYIVEQKQNAGFTWTVTSSPNCSHSSGRSIESKASKKTITSSSNSIVEIDEGNPNQSILDSSYYSDRSIQKSKARSQRRQNEDLIVSALERLQDNIHLISEVENLLKLDGGISGEKNNPKEHVSSSQQPSMYDWFVPTSFNIEGILTGFSETKRYLILDRIDLFLNDFINAIEEGYDSSDFTIQNIQEAVVFCKVLVQMAIPENEKEDSSLQGTDGIGRWYFRAGMREMIGILSSKHSGTPRRGECDLSLFSLPEEENDNCDTPMTSNLSIGASTLTTIVNEYDNKYGSATKPQHAFGTSIALKQQQHPYLQLHYNGLYLRQAIQMFTTGIQKMTMACSALSQIKGESMNISSFIHVANQIREAYVQLISLSQRDLKSIVDAFEFELDTEATYADHFEEEICEIIDDDEPMVPTKETENIQSPIVFAETLGCGILNDKESMILDVPSDKHEQLTKMEKATELQTQERLVEKFETMDIINETKEEVSVNEQSQESLPTDIWRMRSVDSDDEDDNCSFVSLFVTRYRNLDSSRLEV